MKHNYLSLFVLFLYFFGRNTSLGAQCLVTADAGEDLYMCAPQTIITDGTVDGNYLGWYWSPLTPGLKGLHAPLKVTNTIKYYLHAMGVDPTKNLIQNPDFEQGNVGFTSSLIYSPGNLVPTGAYDILSNPQSANGSFEACSDHTSGSGNMLTVHLATQSGGLEIWKQSVPVTPSTLHHYYFWIASANSIGPPGIAFRINGNQMLVAFPIITPQCTWYMYKGSWNSGGNTTAELTLSASIPIDQAAIILDDFYFGPVCEAVDSVTYYVTPPQAVATPAIYTIPCQGYELTLNGEGSSVGPQFTYHWETDNGNIVSGQNSLHPVINAPGDYTLTVDLPQAIEGECFKSVVVRVNEANPPLTAGIYSLQSLNCLTNSILLNGQYSQPAGDLIFQWTAGPGGNIVSGANSPNVLVNQPGEYTLLLTNPSSGCTAEASYTANAPVLPTASIQPPPLLYPNDTLTLSAAVQPANGTVSWSTPNGHITGGANTLNPKITTAGTYILTVTNPANGCTATTSIIVVAVQPCPVSANAGEDVFLCEPGAVILQGSVTGPLHNMYWWPETGISDPAALSPTATVSQTTEYVLTARAYDPTLNLLTNADFEVGNSAFSSDLTYSHFNLQFPRRYDVLMFSFDANPTSYPRCNDHTTGNGNMLASSNTDTSAYLNRWCQTIPVTSGTDYVFNGWALHLAGSGQIAFQANGTSFGTLSVPQDSCIWNTFSSTWYSSIHTSATICIGSDDPDLAFALDDLFFSPLCAVRDTVRVLVDDTPTVAVATVPHALSCLAETVTLQANGSGGGPIIGYQWSTVTGNILSGANTPTPVANAPGTYVLLVTDLENGCTALAETIVTQDIAAPDIAVSPTHPLTCALTTQVLSGQNATPSGSFSYLWTAANGGHFVTGETTLQPQIDAPGTYTLLATNTGNGCTAVVETIVTQDIATPDIVVLPAQPLTCTLANQTLTGQNATPSGSFSYLWTASNGGHIATGETTLQPHIDAPGTYTLLATNTGNGCTAVVETIVTQDIAVPDIAVSPAQPLTCTLTAQPLQGQNNSTSGSFSYLWTAANGGHIDTGETTLQPQIDAPGTYTLLATNIENGCTAEAEVIIILNSDISVTLTNQIDASCFGSTDGALGISATGGDGTYTFLWSSGANTPEASNLPAGTYNLVVTDGAGCTAVVTAIVGQPDPVLPNASATAPTAPGSSDGSASAIPSGGVPPYVFAWTDGSTEPVLPGLPAGFYTVTVTDANGCSAEQTVTVPDVACNLAAGISATDPLCAGAANGSATASPLGGSGPFSYLWDTGDTDPTAAGLVAGTYSVVVTDGNGCQFIATAILSDPVLLSLEPGIVIGASCPNTADGSANVLPAGGTGGVFIVWSNGQTGPSATGLPAGLHTATATDANGCTAVASVSVQASDTEPPAIQGGPATVLLGPAGSISLTLQNLGISATDNCELTDVQIEPGQFDCLQLGQQIATVTATDASGNTAVFTLSVTVADLEPPVVVCPQNIRSCYDERTLEYLAPVATDNCLILGGNFDLLQGFPSGAEFPVGETVTIYSFTDASGNVGSCSFSVTVLTPILVKLDAIVDDLAAQNIGSILVSVSGSKPGYSFAWQRNGQPFAASEDLIGVGLGVYTLLVTDAEGCTTLAGPFEVDDLVGAKNPAWAEQVRVYPNPTSGQVFVVLPEMLLQQAIRFTVLDAAGKHVLEQSAQGNKQVELDWQNLSEGQYVLMVLTPHGQAAYRIIVAR